MWPTFVLRTDCYIKVVEKQSENGIVMFYVVSQCYIFFQNKSLLLHRLGISFNRKLGGSVHAGMKHNVQKTTALHSV